MEHRVRDFSFILKQTMKEAENMVKKGAMLGLYVIGIIMCSTFCLWNPLINQMLREATMHFTPEKRFAGVVVVLIALSIQIIAACIVICIRRKIGALSVGVRALISILLLGDTLFSLYQLVLYVNIQKELALGTLIIANTVAHLVITSLLFVLNLWNASKEPRR